MANPTHTPGPWTVRGETDEDAGAVQYGLGIDPATNTTPGGWPYFIRQDRDFPIGSGPLWLAHGIQVQADARLIAASPDLLTAAKMAHAKLTRLGVTAGETVDALNAAIAKAEGGAV